MLEVKGLDQLQKKLKALQDNVRQLDGRHNVPVNELLTPAFVSRYTKFSTAEDLFEASGYKIESEEDFAAIPDDAWNQYIRSVSNFSGWEAMLSKAAESWAAKKLGF